MTRFYLGTHRGRWLEDHQFSGVPLFVTYNTLSAYQRHGDDFPKGIATDYAIDSGYTEISNYGEWRDPPDIYGGRIYRFVDDIGRPPDFVAIQDMRAGRAGRVRLYHRRPPRVHARLAAVPAR